MSYEYEINLKNISDLNAVLDAFQDVSLASGISCFKDFGVIYIKDPNIFSSWKYDVAIFSKEAHLEISLVGWSSRLYGVFKRVLGGLDFNIIDDDLEEEITLEEMFRI